jgi:hypothetical protein
MLVDFVTLITHHPSFIIHHQQNIAAIPSATYATDDNYSTINRRSSMHSKFSLKPFLEAAYHIRHKMHVSTLLRVDGSFNLLSYAA